MGYTTYRSATVVSVINYTKENFCVQAAHLTHKKYENCGIYNIHISYSSKCYQVHYTEQNFCVQGGPSQDVKDSHIVLIQILPTILGDEQHWEK